MKKISRRTFLKTAVRASVAGMAGLALSGCSTFRATAYKTIDPDAGLGKIAAANDKLYGVALQSQQLKDDVFAAAVQREAALLVPETELKWDVLRPSPQRFNFAGYHRLAVFAKENNMAMRGHTLVWHDAIPKWLPEALEDTAAAEGILRTHIERVVQETSAMITNWDVVNEAFDPHSTRKDGLRETLWLKALGPDYLALAFCFAHEANPDVTLVYNDFGFEYGDGYGHAKRQALLRWLEGCRKEKTPVHAIGLQSHLICGRALAGAEFLHFLKDLRSLGLKIYVTELDLNLSKLSGRRDDRIKFGQIYVQRYLDMLQESGAVDMLLTWGISDSHTWLHAKNRDVSGALPLDASYNRTPLWETLRTRWAEA
ncbi:MAG: endo-1,4-beta-xylanase [Pseudomonadota bacterium]|nr:endo-1,4-beta-xylanase [Pseudomonadota bacterium]